MSHTVISFALVVLCSRTVERLILFIHARVNRSSGAHFLFFLSPVLLQPGLDSRLKDDLDILDSKVQDQECNQNVFWGGVIESRHRRH